MFSHRRLRFKVLEKTLSYQESYLKPYHYRQKLDQRHHSHIWNPTASIYYKIKGGFTTAKLLHDGQAIWKIKKHVSMRPWVTISEVKEAITAKDIVMLQTYLLEVWSWFQRNICDPRVTWDEKCCTSLGNGVRDENVNRAVRWCYCLEIQGWCYGLFMFWSCLKTCLMDHGFLMSLEKNKTLRNSRIIKALWTNELVFVSEKGNLRILQY